VRHISPVGLIYNKDGMAGTEVWEDEIPYLTVGYYKLWAQQKG